MTFDPSPLFLSLDVGTSSVKAAIVSARGDILRRASAAYSYVLLPGEKNELRPNDLQNAIVSAVSKLDEASRAKVDCLCYDTFSPSPVFMDASGALVYGNIITHLDRRARAYSQTIDDVMGNETYMDISGFLPFAGGCSLMTVLWFKEHLPGILRNTRHIGHLTTYLHHLFTGEWMVDRVNASMLGVYNTVGDDGWSDKILSAFDLRREWFGDIWQPGEKLGKLLPDMADALGVRRGIPVAVGTNDMAASQVGAGNRQSGRALNSAGSSDMIGILTNQPLPDKRYYLRCAADRGLWQIYATTVGGFAVDWFYDQFCREMPGKEALYASLTDAVATYLCDSSVTFAPYLAGDRQSLEKKTAAWNGLTLATTREEMLIAMLRSFQGALYGVLEIAADKNPVDKTIRITGGMLSDAYLKVKAHAMPGYAFMRVEDCALRGNTVLASEGY